MKCMICNKHQIPLWQWLLFLGHAICKECDLEMTPGIIWSEESDNKKQEKIK